MILPIHPAEPGKPALDALIYIAAIEENVPRPNAEYRRLMVEGARQWNLPPSYIASLEALEVDLQDVCLAVHDGNSALESVDNPKPLG